jgi:LPS-assembly lipoprotein
MQKLSSLIITLLLFSLLSGCGFHLRKNAEAVSAKYPVIILPFSGSHTFYRSLRRSLLAHSIDLLDEKPVGETECYPILNIVSEEQTIQPIIYGPESELRRERLFLTIIFSFGFTCPQEIAFTAVRDHQLYSSQHLGDNAEKSLLETEMQADIIRQFLRYIESEQFD